MHEELFHSPDRPFRATPDCKFYFPHETIETARQTIVRAVNRAEGPVMVLGGAGLGKSLLGMLVADELAPRFDVVKLHAARLCSRRALLQNILFELQLPYRDLTEGDLRLSILNRLEVSSDHAPDGILMVVDEAHTLPAKLLDELRLITNFTRGNQPRARLVLIGNLRLEHTFAEPQLESFNQRLAARCYLQPMNRQQTRDYVGHQFTVAGLTPRSMITEDALTAVYAASEGVPRLANQIMDHALVLAIKRGQCPVSSALIEESWADLQQLPAPWHAGAERFGAASDGQGTRSHAVEFGELDVEDVDEPLTADAAPQLTGKQVPCAASMCEATSVQRDDEELRLAEDPAETTPSKQPSSFFAAFVAPDEDDSADPPCADMELYLQDEPAASTASFAVVSAEPTCEPQPSREAADEDLLTRPRVVFDMQQARERARQLDREIDQFDAGDAELPLLLSSSSDSFFASRPTDERMLALKEEQREFDSMGVWENDPPLTCSTEGATAAATQSRTRQDLFGDDFEEEVCLTSADLRRVSGNEFSSAQAASAAEDRLGGGARLRSSEDDYVDSQAAKTAVQAAAAADYLARMQQVADEVIASGSADLAQDRVSATMERGTGRAANPTDFSFQSAFDTWSVDVAAMDIQNEVAVQDEIEDLVSQLNFAAFSVEPFSVEQIEITPRDQRAQPPQDAMRSGPRDEIYTLHRPQELSEESVFNGWTADATQHGMDDDRDLLIVEEDLPQTARTTNEAEPQVTKIAPYSQLFAKLRK